MADIRALELEQACQRLLADAERFFPSKSIPFTIGNLSALGLFRLLDHVLVSAPTLEIGLSHWADLCFLLDSPQAFRIERTDAVLVLHIQHSEGIPTWLLRLFQALYLRLAAVHKDAIQLYTRAARVQPVSGMPGSLPRLRIHTGASEDKCEILTHRLTCAYPFQVPDIHEDLRLLLAQLKPYTYRQLGFADLIKRILHSSLPELSSMGQVAEVVGINVRTLQRRLAKQNTCFGDILKQVRYEKSLWLLADMQIPLKAIAAQLGFAEQSSFHHAFRKWHGSSPMEYRAMLLAQAHAPTTHVMPVRLFLAENHMQYEDIHARRGGRVWVEVANLSFEKQVCVRCQDLDGIWREYPAFFERFTRPGIELWSTANLPVAEPMRFELVYRTSGATYRDDQNGQGYILPKSDVALLGGPQVLMRRCMLFGERARMWLHCTAYTRGTNPGHLFIEVRDRDGKEQRLRAKLSAVTGSIAIWRYARRVSSDHVTVALEWVTADGVFRDDYNGAGWKPEHG